MAVALLPEPAAADDVMAFRRAVEEDKASALDAGPRWYGLSAAHAAGRPRLEQRMPAMVAALYGSTAVLGCVLSAAPAEAAHLLLAAGASADVRAFSGLRAGDLLPRANAAADRDRALRVLLKSPAASRRPCLKIYCLS